MEVNTIFLGDAFDLLASLPNQSVGAVISDIPYGDTTKNEWDTLPDLGRLFGEFNRIIQPNSAVILTATFRLAVKLMEVNGKHFRHELIWKKNTSSNHLNANIAPLPAHELILVFSQGRVKYFPVKRVGEFQDKSTGHRSSNYGEYGEKSNWGDTYLPTSVWDISHDKEKSITFKSRPDKMSRHPTQKPLALMEMLVRTYTEVGDLIVDPFCGSGTTGVAARKWERNFIMGDIDPRWVKIAKRRIARMDLQTIEMNETISQPSLFGDK